MYLKNFLLILYLLLTHTSFAQKPFKEGTLIYAVTIDPPANQEGITQYTGVYKIVVKDKQLRRELNMDNGFKNVIIQDEHNGTGYALKEVQGSKMAIELDPDQTAKRRSKYEGFEMKVKGNASAIAGFAVKKGIAKYKDGSSVEVFYTEDYTSGTTLFDHFPLFAGLPLEFSVRNEDGMMMHFKIKDVSVEPVENMMFKVSQDYKIMNNNEYKQLSNSR